MGFGVGAGGRIGKVAAAAVLCGLVMALAACSAGRALNKSSEKDYDVLEVGTDRDLVRAELGQPMVSASADNCDLFSFEEGSGGFKYLRAVGYSLLAVGTLGISEVVTNPVEAAVGNDKVRVRVCYDSRQSVRYSELLRVGKPAKLMTGQYPPPAPVVATPVVAPPPPPAAIAEASVTAVVEPVAVVAEPAAEAPLAITDPVIPAESRPSESIAAAAPPPVEPAASVEAAAPPPTDAVVPTESAPASPPN